MPVVGVVGTVTLTLRLHVLLGAMEPFEKVNDVAPALGEKVGLPQPDVVAPGTADTTIAPGAAGRLSEKLTPAIVDDVGLAREKLSVAEPPATVAAGAKALAIVTCAGSMIEAMRAELEKSLL